MAPARPCLACVLRMRGARWGAKLLKIKGFSSDVRSRKYQKRPIHGRMHIVRTMQGFMHITPISPTSRCTYIPTPNASHHASPQRITSRHTPNAGTSRITPAHHVTSREAMLLIRSTLPMSNVADSFSLRKAILGPSEDKYPKG